MSSALPPPSYSQPSDKPFGNCYWVSAGQLLAGEYPLTGNNEESAVRLQNLLLAGVNYFVDLTVADELPAYEGRLPARFSGKPVSYRRCSIPDHRVPASIEQMRATLNAIDDALAAGACVYVHCRAGIGRTGTVVGCYLVRHGHTGPQAVEALNSLWQACGRAANWPNIPETAEQENFVLQFTDEMNSSKPVVISEPTQFATQVGVKLASQLGHSSGEKLGQQLGLYQGALLGLVIADVVGTTQPQVATIDPATEADVITNLATSKWGSDAAMALALADSLLTCKQMHAEDQMQRYLAWQKQGKYTAEGNVVDVPPLVQKALGLWQWRRSPFAGSHDPHLIDAHPLARSAVVALYFAHDPVRAVHEAAESARCTSQAPIVLDACKVFAALLLALQEGMPQAQLMQLSSGKAFAILRAHTLKPEIVNLIDGGWRTAMSHPAGNDIVSVLASAMHALFTTNNFQAAIFKSMQKATSPATVAAVCGALAGARYGVQGVPIVWRETVPKVNELLALSERLANER